MIGEVVQTPTGEYVRCVPQSGILTSEADVLDLLAECYGIESSRILLDEEHLHPEFFDLSSGLAGALFHKLSVYQVRVAIVADLAGIKSQRFRELIHECNQGDDIHFFDHESQAEQWLTAQGGNDSCPVMQHRSRCTSTHPG